VLAQAMLTSMCQQLFQLYSQCIDASKNLARYYAHSIQPTLFGQTSLMRCWGRIGRRGQEKVHRFFDEQQPVSLFSCTAARRAMTTHAASGKDSPSFQGEHYDNDERNRRQDRGERS
jgi:predicted DNA-binding WGR domain protein